MSNEVQRDSWLQRRMAGAWRRSRAVAPVADERKDCLLLSSAIRGVLSRSRGEHAKRQFAASLKVYRTLSLQLVLRRPMNLCPNVLNDALHEIASHVDRPVRDAGLRSLLRARGRRA